MINFISYICLGLFGIILSLLGLFFRKKVWGEIVCLVFTGLYSIALAKAMFFPFSIPFGWPTTISWKDNLQSLSNSLNLIPFDFQRLITHYQLGQVSAWMVFWQTIGNILIMIPFGIGIGWLTKARGWRVLSRLFLVGILPEVLQLIFLLLGIGNQHIIDVNDLILNILGVLIGYGIFLLARKVITQFRPLVPTDNKA